MLNVSSTYSRNKLFAVGVCLLANVCTFVEIGQRFSREPPGKNEESLDAHVKNRSSTKCTNHSQTINTDDSSAMNTVMIFSLGYKGLKNNNNKYFYFISSSCCDIFVLCPCVCSSVEFSSVLS